MAMMGTVPGYWVSVALIDYMGRVPIQFMGKYFGDFYLHVKLASSMLQYILWCLEAYCVQLFLAVLDKELKCTVRASVPASKPFHYLAQLPIEQCGRCLVWYAFFPT